MTAKPSAAPRPTKLAVRRDLPTVRKMLRRIKYSVRLADLALFGRRNPERMADYLDRRHHDRSPVEIPVYVLPVEFDGWHAARIEGADTELLAMTKDVSLRGIGLLHDELLEGNHAVVTIDVLDGRPASLLLEIRWSNIERRGTYMSGGRFLGVSDSPDLPGTG